MKKPTPVKVQMVELDTPVHTLQESPYRISSRKDFPVGCGQPCPHPVEAEVVNAAGAEEETCPHLSAPDEDTLPDREDPFAEPGEEFLPWYDSTTGQWVHREEDPAPKTIGEEAQEPSPPRQTPLGAACAAIEQALAAGRRLPLAELRRKTGLPRSLLDEAIAVMLRTGEVTSTGGSYQLEEIDDS